MPSRERSFHVEAVILRHSEWGEADRLITLFTLELGKVRAVAKGVRKARSRKAGHLEPFTQANLILARGRDTLLITQAETIHPFIPLRNDLMLTTYAAYVVELVDRFTIEEGENQLLFSLLVDTFQRLLELEVPEQVIRYYELCLLDLVGFRPQLFTCVGCTAIIQPEDQFFSALQGGVLCPRCGRDMPGVRPVSMNALKFLRHYQRSSWDEARRASIPTAINRELDILMQHYFTYLLERNLNTPSFIRRLRRELTSSEGETRPSESS